MGKARTKFELFGYEKTTGPQFLGGQAGRQELECRAFVVPINMEVTQTSNAFPCACQIYTPPQTITADGGQRGKKRFVALAEMTHTLASRRRLLTIRFIAPAENTHTPWQAALPLFFRQARAGSDRDAGA